MDVPLRHAKAFAETLSHCDKSYIIHLALVELELYHYQDAFNYAKNTIILLCEDPMLRLSNGAYAEAARMSGVETDVERVEKNIRQAIRKCWKEREQEMWCCYFTAKRMKSRKCPTNKEFLIAIKDFVVMWQGCCEEVNYERNESR